MKRDERGEEPEAGGRPAFEALADAELVEILASAGLDVPEGLAREVVRRRDRMVLPLSRLLLDTDAWEADERGFWAAVHALYLLAAIGTPAVAGPLVELLRLDPGWEFLFDAMPTALGRAGRAALEPLEVYLRDASAPAPLRGGVAVSALVRIGHDDPELRPRVSAALAEVLRTAEPETASYAAARSACVDDPVVRQAIDAAFERAGIDGRILSREQVSSIRAECDPWRSPRAERDPLHHFTPRNLAYLKSLLELDEPASSTGRAPDRSRRPKRKRGKNRR